VLSIITPVAIISVPAIITSLIDKGIVIIKSNSSSVSIKLSSIIGIVMLVVIVPIENVANKGVEV